MNATNPCVSSCSSRSFTRWSTRSEEHTSELQSQSNLVCRLLLENKDEEVPQLPDPVKDLVEPGALGEAKVERRGLTDADLLAPSADALARRTELDPRPLAVVERY